MKLEKRKSHAFGKDYYLLGKKEGEIYWLQSPSWDCNWYWGFGYVNIFTNPMYPNRSRDIDCHTHMYSLMRDNKGFLGLFSETTYSDKEAWELWELFEQFYTLKDMADFTHRGGSHHISIAVVDHGDLSAMHKEINHVMIPKITARILEILTPNEEA